jgi:hypothetical protein
MRRSFLHGRLLKLIVFAATAAVAAGGIVRAAAQTAGQKPALRIVVIEGEDAVNIIQQKTAVAPIVEVRDRNDLPIAGVPVTFSIAGGKGAAFAGGAQQLTVTTNAAGRAAVSGLNPLSAGSYQINVTAAYQGQTAAATITQTNFATAAQAAEAGRTAGQAAQTGGAGTGTGAGAGTAAGAAGAGGAASAGGLSALAIGGIVGGAAAGGLLAVRAATGSEECVFAVTPTTLNAGATGGALTVNVTATPEDCEPNTWTATTNSSFVTVNPANGAGNGTVTITVGANPAGSATRTGSVTVAGQSISITQAAACSFTVSPTSLGPLAGTGASATVNVTVGPAGCSPTTWTASSNSGFITVSPASGNGSGTVTVTLAANPGADRSGTVTIAGQTVNVSQSRVLPPCNAQQVSGGDIPETRTIELGRTSGTFRFNWDTGGVNDRFIIRYEGQVLFDTTCRVAVNQSQTITYSGTSSQISIQVLPNCRTGNEGGDLWRFTVTCPQ